MAYSFNREAASTFKLTQTDSDDYSGTMNVKGVNANELSADSIVAGIQGLFYIANRTNAFNPATAIRVVNEDVDYDE